MSDRIERRVRISRKALAIVIVVIFTAFAGLYLWSRTAPRSPEAPAAVQQKEAPSQAVSTDEPLMIVMFYPSGDSLSTRTVGVKRQPDAQMQAREAVSALVTNTAVDLASLIRSVRIKALYVDSSGTAYVDLSPQGERIMKGSAWEEFLAVHAVVNTLTQNFEEIKEVRFLVDGREAQTLAGHIDMSGFFGPRTDLVRQ